MINGIVCVGKNWEIGKINKETGEGQLLFEIPADLKHFIKLTKNNIVVLGYATYMSLPKRPLKDRVNIVLWDRATSIDCLEGCLTFNNFEQLLYVVKLLAERFEVFICGGASIYKLFLPYYDKVYITKVDAEDSEATAFFPNLDQYESLRCINSEMPIKDKDYTFRFQIYAKIKENN